MAHLAASTLEQRKCAAGCGLMKRKLFCIDLHVDLIKRNDWVRPNDWRSDEDSLHQPAVELIDDIVESVEFVAQIGIDSIRQDQFKVYAGLLGISGQSEIDQDERRLIKNGLITQKVAQYVAYVDCDRFHVSAHATARDAEKFLNLIGVNNLLNSRQGWPRTNDTSIGAVFIMVCV